MGRSGPIRVMVVDDHPMWRDAVARDLTEAGYDVVKLSEGATGWEEEGLELEPKGGYVAESGEAAAILEARKRAS